MLTQKLARSLTARSASSPYMRYLNSSCSNGDKLARAFSSKSHNWIPDVSLDTRIVHGGVVPDEKTGAILTPVYMSTTFVQ